MHRTCNRSTSRPSTWEVSRQAARDGYARDVKVYIGEALPVIVIDTARLELILMNLVSNAIKDSDPEKPQRFVRVETALATDEDFACIVVRENGLGIPEGSLTTIFSRFVRAHPERDGDLKVRGSGLGLAALPPSALKPSAGPFASSRRWELARASSSRSPGSRQPQLSRKPHTLKTHSRP